MTQICLLILLIECHKVASRLIFKMYQNDAEKESRDGSNLLAQLYNQMLSSGNQVYAKNVPDIY